MDNSTLTGIGVLLNLILQLWNKLDIRKIMNNHLKHIYDRLTALEERNTRVDKD